MNGSATPAISVEPDYFTNLGERGLY